MKSQRLEMVLEHVETNTQPESAAREKTSSMYQPIMFP